MSTQAVGAFLGGLGLLGIAVAAFFGILALVFLPLWALLDCAASRRASGEKVGIALALLCTWGLGSVVYGLFFAYSRFLRILTAITVGGVLVVLVPSVATLMAGARMATPASSGGTVQNRPATKASFAPDAVPASEVGFFHAVHFTGSGLTATTAAVARFEHAELTASSARDTDRAIRHVVFDERGNRYWGLTTHDFGAVRATDGHFARIAPSPAVGDFSWPTGIAFDAAAGRVYIATSLVYTRFYRFDPRRSQWERLPAELRDRPIVGLAHLASDACLYALEYQTGDRALRRLQRFNTEGASIGVVELQPAVPVEGGIDVRVQLAAAGNSLVLVLPPDESGAATTRVLVIDPVTGVVRVPTTARPTQAVPGS